ncbi:putative phosphoserine aminotransferase, chloroplastic-like [Capsicum annuum]|nr:putative phosphoserine aminotransferase, chloroplastic-like [Capsicum annuum]
MLHLGRNKLKGNIPAEFASLNKLEEMHVFFNNLSGEIPSCFGNFSSIRLISLIANNFHGTMPDFLGKLGNLEILELTQNNLSGAIPALVFNLSSLRNLELSLNQLEGPIPSSMGFTLPKLEVFNLGANQLTGVLPASVSNLTNLQLFAVDTNNFSGEVPSVGSSQNLYWLGLGENCLGNGKLDVLLFMSFSQNCSALQLLQIDDNQFGGVIPRYFGYMSSLLYLTMSRHLIHGIIPVEISQLRSLQELSLQQNHLTGEIPDSIGEFELLNELHLNENQLSGKIPSCIGNLTMLTKLSLGANNLHGSIHPVSERSILNSLISSHNKFVSKIPDFLASLRSLKYLNLSYNDLEGELPSDGVFRNKSRFSITGNNKLCGSIPEFKLPKCPKNNPSSGKSSRMMILIIALVVGGIVGIIAVAILHWRYNKKRKQRVADNQGSTVMDAVIPRVTYQRLQKATNGFSLENSIGWGNFSSVYKGILDESVDGIKQIAVKCSCFKLELVLKLLCLNTDSYVATTAGATSIALTSRANAPQPIAPAEKPRKFAGIDFKRWQQKMFFYLTTPCLQRFTSEDAPEVPEETSDKEHFMIVEAWKHSDFLCRNYILSGLQDDLYNIYNGTKTSKELWGALERKYKIEDGEIKKFFVARFLDFKMIDSKSVVSHVQELQVIIQDLLGEGISLKNTLVEPIENVLSTHINWFVGLIVNDAFQVAAIIEKLLPMWKDFKNYLKHKRKEMTVENLIVRLRIKDDNEDVKRRSKGNSTINGAHIVEDDQNNPKKRKKVEQGSNQPKKKFKGNCFNCGKIGHKSTDCRAPKKGKKKDQANMIESNKECDDLCAIFLECNLVGNPREWWMDSSATHYVCANKELF